MRDRDHGECLTEDMLTEYLEGTLEPAVKAASEVHLVSCEDCRNELALLMRVLQPDVTANEAAALEGIASVWEKTRERAGTVPRARVSRLFIGIAAIAAVLVLSVLSMRVYQARRAEPKTAGDVVELLLNQNRPFESRIAKQPHLKFVPTRAADDAGVSYPSLAGEMTQLGANGHEMGRFYLLQKEFTRAIAYLDTAEREVGAGAAVHNDLGVAYLESGNVEQFGKAETEFLHALEKDRSFAEAAFNLALFYERTNKAAQAEAQWKRYLELDSKSDWATEARGRLEGISH